MHLLLTYFFCLPHRVDVIPAVLVVTCALYFSFLNTVYYEKAKG